MHFITLASYVAICTLKICAIIGVSPQAQHELVVATSIVHMTILYGINTENTTMDIVIIQGLYGYVLVLCACTKLNVTRTEISTLSIQVTIQVLIPALHAQKYRKTRLY